ncbi:MAG TPA: molybdopterin-dependent oxidoreductase [Calditrichia bacterium]|nr:molybdopterin-dependent oxidoreductase [Calditrichota bacterium]HQV33916.1 molybdopterin-dependent oxidoreductase [Calditrichia bacterium]
MNRRDFIKTGLTGIAFIFIPGMGLVSCTRNSIGPIIDPIALNYCSPVNMPEEEGGFYVQFYEGREYRPADLDLTTWRLRLFQTVNGQVVRETSLSFDDIASRYTNQEESFFQTFQCVGNTPGGFQMSNGYFTGVPLRLFLENDLGVDWALANRVYFRCYDGYFTNHRKERIINDAPRPAYLAYKFNGIPFNDRRDGSLAHGYPVRMVVPEMLGMKSPKAIMEIEVSDRDEVDGYWESRPVRSTEPEITWADVPLLRINSRIYNPVNYQAMPKGTTYRVQGVAVGGQDPVQRVEIGLVKVKNRDEMDGDITWQDATILSRPTAAARPVYDDSNGNEFSEALGRLQQQSWPAPYTWCLWEADLQVPQNGGKYGLFVRATDATGTVQPFVEESAQENADGNNAWHGLIIQAE